jgi:hypothetical protein
VTTFEEVKAQARLARTSVSLCLRGDLVAEHEELERRLRTASRTAPNLGQRSEASQIAEQMQALEQQMAASVTTFTLEAMPALEWSEFYNARPQRQKDDDEQTHNARWFEWVCRLVARSVIEPFTMTAEQVAELVTVLSGHQWDELSDAAWGLNSKEVTVPFSVAASALTPQSEQS